MWRDWLHSICSCTVLGLVLQGSDAFSQQLIPVDMPDEPADKSAQDAPEVQLSMRIMTGFEVEHERPEGFQRGQEDTEYGFFLQQARVKLRVRFNDSIRSNISAELQDALATFESNERSFDGDKVPYLRNAYLNFRFARALQLRAGRFKRPFSRLENRSTGALPFRGRGLSNEVIVEDADWGDRGIGMMLWGRLKKPELTWRASVTNPSWEFQKDDHKMGINAQGRLSWNPLDGFSVGLNGGYMFASHSERQVPDAHFGAFGGDVRIKANGWYLALETIVGQRAIVDTSVIHPVSNEPVIRYRSPYGLGATAYVAYDLALPRSLTLQPVGFLEIADSDLTFANTEAIRSVLGLNLIVGKTLRIMPQVEIIRPLQVAAEGWVDPIERPLNPWENQETYYLLVSLQM